MTPVGLALAQRRRQVSVAEPAAAREAVRREVEALRRAVAGARPGGPGPA
jgi:hypothetical protein